jgi:signal transduction histidine kinase
LKTDAFLVSTQLAIALLIGAIVATSIGLFFYLETLQNEEVEKVILEQERLKQIRGTSSLSQGIGSDLEVILARLELLANTEYMQQGDYANEELLKLINEQKERINEITLVDYLFVNDKDGISRINIIPEGAQSFVGRDFSSREYFTEAKSTLQPVFSNGYVGADGVYRIAIVQPIVNRQTGEFLGVVGISMPTVQFFEQYGNVHDAGTQFLVAFDKNANILANPSSDLVGKNFFGDEVQSSFQNNEQQIKDYQDLFNGKSSSSIANFGPRERIATREPVLVLGKPEYFITVSTPTSTIAPQIDDLLFKGTLQVFVMIAGVLAGVVGLIMFMARWNKTLSDGIRKRTSELNDSNRRLMESNEKLTNADKMQKEFINIAAHELRTPTQAIMAYAEALQNDAIPSGPEDYDAIARNAKRLQRLTEDILDVTRIEVGKLTLKSEKFMIDEVINSAIQDARSQEPNSNVKLLFEPKGLVIEADKDRISQVIYNLLTNAMKFTKEGNITIKTSVAPDLENGDSRQDLIIEVSDSGTGIDADIFPRLFNKFATKSEKGTGLGLYITKSIAEAHGGTISARNNDNKGATFALRIPMASTQTVYTSQFSETKAL